MHAVAISDVPVTGAASPIFTANPQPVCRNLSDSPDFSGMMVGVSWADGTDPESSDDQSTERYVMTWFTETPWPPIFILGIAAALLLAIWSSQKQGSWLIGAVILCMAAVAVFFVERAIFTEAERVEQNILDLTAAFQRKDRERTLSFFSMQAPDLRDMAVYALNLVDFPKGIDIKDVSVRLTNENTRAIAHFRANGTVSVRGFATQHAASRWQVTWQKEGNDWKIIDVVRLDPIKDEKMPILEHRAN
jgi:hypothetical protein